MVFPYLPLSKRVIICSWELIPKSQLAVTDATSNDMVEYAHGVAALYAMPGRQPGYGAFVRHTTGRVGDKIDRTRLWALHDSVVVPLIDRNPSLGDPDHKEDPNAGHRMCTTEHALLYSHRFDGDLYTGYETGTMVVMRHLGARIGEARDVIAPPSDLALPSLGLDFDAVYANALYDVLTNLADDDPDLPAAIRWFEIAWANSAVVDLQTRIMALRAAFDALFGSAYTETVRDRLAEFLDPDGQKVRREWINHRGCRHEAELTDVAWWFQMFAQLRNKIAHGGALVGDDFIFEGVPHVWRAEWVLRRVFKQILVNRGHDDVVLDDFDRIIRKHIPSEG
jgi:hypothetical protein